MCPRFYIVALAVLGCTQYVQAASLSTPEPIDVLRDALFSPPKPTKKKPKPSKLQRLQSAIISKNYNEIRKSAQGFKTDPLLADLGFTMSASSDRDECIQKTDQKKYADAIQAGNRAIQVFLEAESRFPYSPLLKHIPEELGQTELALAEAYFGKKDSAQAEEYFERSFQRLTVTGTLTQTLKPIDLEKYGKNCAKKTTSLCQAWGGKLASNYPRTSQEGKTLVQYFPDSFEKPHFGYGNGKATLAYKGPDLDQAAFDGAFALFEDNRISNAIRAFEQFLDDYPKSAYRYRVRYWLGQCYLKDGHPEKLQKTYADLIKDSPLTYYGLLASLETKTSLPDLFKPETPSAVSDDHMLWPVEIIRLKRAQRFASEGLMDFASDELKDFKPRDALSSHFLLYLSMMNFEVGNFSTTFGMIQELINRNFEGIYTQYGLNLIFPIAFKDLIQKYSYQSKIDPVVVMSLIKQESAFDAKISSNVGASGLMQLMPNTASETESAIRRADLVDPENNIRVGTKYLKQLLNHYNNNIALSLAAYNSGPFAVDRWIREGRGKNGLLEFIELIPYKETREYVASIIRNYFWYAKKLGATVPRDVSFFWTAPNAPIQPEAAPSPILQGVPPQTPVLDDTA